MNIEFDSNEDPTILAAVRAIFLKIKNMNFTYNR